MTQKLYSDSYAAKHRNSFREKNGGHLHF